MDIRRGLRSASSVWCGALLWACGGDGAEVDIRDLPVDPAPRLGDAGDRADAGRQADAGSGMEGGVGLDGGGDGGDAMLAPNAGDAGDAGDAGVATGPVVAVRAPVASNDPGIVLKGDSVDVDCHVTGRPGQLELDPSTVRVALYAETMNGFALVKEAPAVFRGEDLYRASVALDKEHTGRVRIGCRAQDRGSEPAFGEDTIETFFDGGPKIEFTNLTNDTIIARGTDTKVDLSVSFKVEPQPLVADDPGAAVDSVSLRINDIPITNLAAPVAGVYSKEIDFRTFFAQAVDKVTVEVTATNKRTPGAATVTEQLVLLVDGAGPAITVDEPARMGEQPPLVGGTVTVGARIDDAMAGVAEGMDKVYALISGSPQRYPLTRVASSNVYKFSYIASAFEDKAEVVAQIHAYDKVGNYSIQSHTMRLDTKAPWVSLDPAPVRVTLGTEGRCSGPLDPVGSSPNEGQVIEQHARFRSVVWERAIARPGATETWISGVRDGSVTLYAQFYGAAQTSTSTPLLVDTDQDGKCDDVYVPQQTGQPRPYVTTLAPVSTGGSLPPGEEAAWSFDPIPGPECALPLLGNPISKCLGSEMSYVIAHTEVGRSPVIYANLPTSGPPTCTGASFDLSGPGGWTCVVVTARDKAGSDGNLGVSQPLRVCRKLQDSDCGGAAPGTILTPPAELTCTDGCMIPAPWLMPAMPRVLAQ